MDNTRIIGDTEPLRRFMSEWNDSSLHYVTAHTSGSTGAPKPIRLFKNDMLVSARSTCDRFGVASHSLLALPLSADYIAGKMMVVRADVAACRLYVEEPSSHPFASYPESLPPPTLAAVVPMQLAGLLDAVAKGLVPMPEVLLVGGAPLSLSMEHDLLSAGVEAYVTYGMTETCSNVALRRVGSPVYEANPGVTFATDARDCLVVKWPEMSFGSITTNDVVRLLPGGREFQWLGRYDNVVNSGGVKLHPEVIEARLASLLPAGSFCVTSEPHPLLGQQLVGVVERGVDLSVRVLEAVDSCLSRYERPRRWVTVESLPRTSNGKLNRVGLAELLG